MKTGIYWQDPKYAIGRRHTVPGCVLYLPLHSLDGASFMSKDARGYLCTVTGALWRPNGRWFDATDDKIACGRNAVFNSAIITLEAWISADVAPTSGSWRTIISKDYRAYEFTVGYAGAGDYHLYLLMGDGTNYDLYDSLCDISLNTWYHAAVTIDGANVRFYVNGALVKTLSQLKTIGTVDTDLVVGQRSPSGEKYGGIIGEVGIYNRVLTPLEIQHRYLATKRRYR